MSAVAEVVEKTPETPAGAPAGDGAAPAPTVGDAPKADAAPAAEEAPKAIEIDPDDIRALDRQKAAYDQIAEENKRLKESEARLKGVAGKQAREITRLKQPARVEAEDYGEEAPEAEEEEFAEDAATLRRRPTTAKGQERYDEALARVNARLDEMESQQRTAAEAARETREREAFFTLEQGTADTGVKAGMAYLNITDPEVADVSSFVLDAMLKSVARERGVSLASLGQSGLTEALQEILPSVESILGYRHRAQAADNEQYRALHPTKTTGAPGVTAGRLPAQMSQAERDRLYGSIAAKHDGSAA
jgi:hypothetical protein